ncbi:EAL domain-containing protein [Cetobacterium sp. 2G large]|uniref:EAL domain-containing protein n=1 Tax=Cetobacterium sp. 2G large TaxID=2759680 RepID=UPI00163C9267|nr:EAL domain-containing protein [Cetobacterium sp. 2G large]MBC2853439.1 EAL domain-containing protein [Cetobacterium sp. 2G large]
MSIKRILLVFFLSFKFIISMDVYVPKNDKEKKYLEKIREKQLVLGIKNNYFADDKIESQSLNDIIEELLKDYLQLNIVIKKDNWDIIYNEFQKGEIDIINFLTKTNEREKFAVFSNKILAEELVIVSRDKKLNTAEDLNEKKVYVTKNTIYEKFLERYKMKNELQMKIIKVDDVNLKKLDYFADTNLNTIGESNKLSISRLPETSIGVNKSYKDLNYIINNALEEKYSKKMENWLKKRKEFMFKDKFLKSLTDEEKEYIQNMKPLKISYGNIENVSSYSVKDKKFVGVLPGLLDCLFKKLSINIKQEEKTKKIEWTTIYEDFNNGKIDILTLSRTPEREEKFIFTKKIYDLNVYQIEVLKNLSSKRKVGVIKNSIEETVAKEYFFKDNIKIYSNRDEMLSDLKNNKLTTVLSLNSDIYDKKKYNIRILENVPINLALNKNNIVLRDILNKAILEMVDLKDILKNSELNKRKEIITEQEKHKNLVILVTLSCILLLGLALYQSFKVFMHKRKNRELLKDELTGLYSRRVYNEFCKNNNSITGCTLLMDLNNFKLLNDTHGHDYGDQVLIEAGKLLKEVFKNDYIFRISGDEFYIFSCYSANIKYKIKKLETLFKSSNLMKKYNISFSLGYYLKKEKNSMEYAFKYADLAMYSAKKGRENWSQEATYNFIKSKKRKKIIENLISKSINIEFYPVFQKKYALKDGKIIGAEALTRWNNNLLGEIYPDEFIPIAENLGLIYKVDYKIAEEAVKKTKQLLRDNIVDKNFRMSFNMSIETLKRKDVVEVILDILKKYSLSGKNLEIEITESTFLNDAEDVVVKLNKFRENGIYLSIDDFTAGYSTVGLLTTLPIDVVKFDKSLISSINEESERGKNVYLGLTNMIKSLKLKVVAEGIEEREQFEFLKEIGVSYGQGYYFGKPERELKNV